MISPNTNMNMEQFLIIILVVIASVGIVIFITTYSEAEIQTHQETRNNLQNNLETKIIFLLKIKNIYTLKGLVTFNPVRVNA